MKNLLWPCCLLLLTTSAFSQPQNGPALESPNDEMTEYQTPLPNEGHGTGPEADAQAQEDRDFNKNRDYDREERQSDWDHPDYEEETDPTSEEDLELDE